MHADLFSAIANFHVAQIEAELDRQPRVFIPRRSNPQILDLARARIAYFLSKFRTARKQCKVMARIPGERVCLTCGRDSNAHEYEDTALYARGPWPLRTCGF